jgi:hypothetical protein
VTPTASKHRGKRPSQAGGDAEQPSHGQEDDAVRALEAVGAIMKIEVTHCWRSDAPFFGQIKQDQILAVAEKLSAGIFRPPQRPGGAGLAVVMGQLLDPAHEEQGSWTRRSSRACQPG